MTDEKQVPGPAAEPSSRAQTPTEPIATPAEPPLRRLVRRREGKILGGVSTGIAAYTGIDPVLVRIGFVLGAIISFGVVVLIYIVMWLVMPMAREGEPLPPPPRTIDSSNVTRWTGIGILLLGALLLFSDVWRFRGGIFWGLLLIGIGIALWSGRPQLGTRRPDSSFSPPLSETSTPPSPPPPPPPPAPTQAAASPAPAPSPGRREPSVLGRLVVGAAALAVGIAVLLDNLDVIGLTPRGVIAMLLAVVAVGLLVGTWWGRARWLVFPGIALTLLLATTAVLPTHVRGSFGDVVWQPTTRADLRPVYEHGAGQAVLDLSQVAFGRRTTDIDVRVGFGELLVVIPEDAPARVAAHVQGGEMNLFGRVTSGWNVRDDIRMSGDRDLGPLSVDITMNFGEILVRHPLPHDDFSVRENRRGWRRGPVGSAPRVEVNIGRSAAL